MRNPNKNKNKNKNLDQFISGDNATSEIDKNTPNKPKQRKSKGKKMPWDTSSGLDDTKLTEMNVNVLLSEYHRESATKLAETLPQFRNRKHLFQMILVEGINKLIAEQE